MERWLKHTDLNVDPQTHIENPGMTDGPPITPRTVGGGDRRLTRTGCQFSSGALTNPDSQE